MSDDVDSFYTNLIPNERRSRWLSGLKREVLGGAFRYRIGIRFVSIVVQNLIVHVYSLPSACSLPNNTASEQTLVVLSAGLLEYDLCWCTQA